MVNTYPTPTLGAGVSTYPTPELNSVEKGTGLREDAVAGGDAASAIQVLVNSLRSSDGIARLLAGEPDAAELAAILLLDDDTTPLGNDAQFVRGTLAAELVVLDGASTYDDLIEALISLMAVDPRLP